MAGLWIYQSELILNTEVPVGAALEIRVTLTPVDLDEVMF